MDKYRRLSIIMIVISTIAIAASLIVSISVLSKDNTADVASSPSLLFVYEGENAFLQSLNDTNDEFYLAVPIESGSSMMTWFTDRPYRNAGHLTYNEFVQLFNTDEEDSFKKDPPNVAVQIEDTTLIATMTKPIILQGSNGKTAIGANFKLVTMDEKQELASEVSFVSKRSYRTNALEHGGTGSIKRVSVFVDNFENDEPVCTHENQDNHARRAFCWAITSGGDRDGCINGKYYDGQHLVDCHRDWGNPVNLDVLREQLAASPYGCGYDPGCEQYKRENPDWESTIGPGD